MHRWSNILYYTMTQLTEKVNKREGKFSSSCNKNKDGPKSKNKQANRFWLALTALHGAGGVAYSLLLITTWQKNSPNTNYSCSSYSFAWGSPFGSSRTCMIAAPKRFDIYTAYSKKWISRARWLTDSFISFIVLRVDEVSDLLVHIGSTTSSVICKVATSQPALFSIPTLEFIFLGVSIVSSDH